MSCVDSGRHGIDTFAMGSAWLGAANSPFIVGGNPSLPDFKVDNIGEIASAGADTFVLSEDGARDHVKDYEDGSDLLDISAWSGVTFDALAFKNLNGGKVQITFGSEQLFVMNSTRDLTLSDLTEADFLLA